MAPRKTVVPEFAKNDIKTIKANIKLSNEEPVENEKTELEASLKNGLVITRTYKYVNAKWTYLSSTDEHGNAVDPETGAKIDEPSAELEPEAPIVTSAVAHEPAAPVAPTNVEVSSEESDSDATPSVDAEEKHESDRSDNEQIGSDAEDAEEEKPAKEKKPRKPRAPKATKTVASSDVSLADVLAALEALKVDDAKEMVKVLIASSSKKGKKRSATTGEAKVKREPSAYNKFISAELMKLGDDKTIQPKDRMKKAMENWREYKKTLPTATA